MGLLGLFSILNLPLAEGINASNLWPLLYMGVFVSGLGFFFYFSGMGLTSASMGSIVFFIKPALAPVLSWLIIGESLSAELLIGIVFIAAGSLCMYKMPSETEHRLNPN